MYMYVLKSDFEKMDIKDSMWSSLTRKNAISIIWWCFSCSWCYYLLKLNLTFDFVTMVIWLDTFYLIQLSLNGFKNTLVGHCCKMILTKSDTRINRVYSLLSADSKRHKKQGNNHFSEVNKRLLLQAYLWTWVCGLCGAQDGARTSATKMAARAGLARSYNCAGSRYDDCRSNVVMLGFYRTRNS